MPAKGRWTVAVKQHWMDRPIFHTLEAMAGNANADLETPSVIGTARRLVSAPGIAGNQYAMALAIRAWLDSVWHFVDDPLEREYLRKPVDMMRDYQELGYVIGDCDEAATLGAALAKSVGLCATFTVLAFPTPDDGGADAFSHVYASILTNDGREVELDITRPHGPVPVPTRSATIDV